jgi:hypothetical protein
LSGACLRLDGKQSDESTNSTIPNALSNFTQHGRARRYNQRGAHLGHSALSDAIFRSGLYLLNTNATQVANTSAAHSKTPIVVPFVLVVCPVQLVKSFHIGARRMDTLLISREKALWLNHKRISFSIFS